MNRVGEIGISGKEAWNRYVQNAPDSIAWQMYDWSEVVCRHYDYRFLPIAARDGETITGILPLYLGPVGKKPRLISVPFAVAGGIVADNEAVRFALLDRAIELSKEAGGIPVTLKQYKIRMPGNWKTDESYFNRELSLTGGTAAIRSQLSPVNQTCVENAEHLGLEVEYPANGTGLFYNLLLKYQLAQGVPCVGEDWIQSLIQFGLYSCAMARFQGEVVAATLVKKFRKTVSFPFTCVRPEMGNAVTAAYGMYWSLITRFASEGVEIFHSGRLPRNQEAPVFRTGWGGTVYPYYYQYYPDTRLQTESGERRGWKRKAVSAAWKAMPLGVARRLGPMVVRHFP